MVNLDGKTCIHTTETIYSYAKDAILNKSYENWTAKATKQTCTIHTYSVHSFVQKSEKDQLIHTQRQWYIILYSLEFLEPRYNKKYIYIHRDNDTLYYIV